MPIESRPEEQNRHRVISVDRTADRVVVEFEDGRTVVLEPDWLYQTVPASMTLVDSSNDGGTVAPPD